MVAICCNPFKEQPIHAERPYTDMTLIDTSNLVLERAMVDVFHEADTRIAYIGPRKEKVILGNLSADYIDDINTYRQQYPAPKAEEIFIYVDTAQVIGSQHVSVSPPPPPLPPHLLALSKTIEISEYEKRKFEKAWRTGFLSFPVIIENLSSDTLRIGYGRHIPVILEAQDDNNEWVPIQKRHRYHCGTGLSTLILPENQILIATCPVLRGKYSTKLRLKFGNERDQFMYSNEFHGNISKKMFDDRNYPDYLY